MDPIVCNPPSVDIQAVPLPNVANAQLRTSEHREITATMIGVHDHSYNPRSGRPEPHHSWVVDARLLKGWLGEVGIEPSAYGTHSLRRTKVALIYRQTGNMRAIQILLGPSRLDSTVRYLGMDIEDALALAEGTDL